LVKTTAAVLCATLLLTMAGPAAADQQWQVGTAPSFSSGKYGTESRTDVFYTPITARRLFANGDVSLVFPFTCIRGDGGVTVVAGSPVRTGTRTLDGTTRDTTLTRTGTTSEATAAPRTTSCGMGDIVIRGRYYAVDERGWIPTIAVRGHLKTPTADEELGLGTGRPDEGVGVEISRMFAATTVMVDGGYTFMGRPAGIDFNDVWWYDVGLGQDLAGDRVNISVFFEEYRAIAPGLDNARDILTAITVKSANGWQLQLSGEFGVSSGAPDRGFTLAASRRF
jgi:hypothetical protein